jgi:Tc toxin complex TcA C-terminal TcB-binding domain/Neuraminidase-like domain/Salmonella virulence plasmid 28.1kDa A protein
MRDDPRFQRFFEQNPDFDVTTFPFLDGEAAAGLDWSGYDPVADRQVAMAWQRVLRLGPPDELAGTLIERGYDSSHAIARVPEWQFAEAFAGEADEGEVRRVHRAATQTKARAQHLWANLHGSIFSPHYRSTRFANYEELADDAAGVPSYQDLFGSLSYATCPHCRSIFGPAAYLVDILRVVEEYVIAKNPGIPPGWKLRERRPDIERIYLTCANTDTVVDYLQVANDVLATRLRAEWEVDDVYRAMATAVYPVDLPFNVALTQVRLTLQALATTLADVYATVAAPPTSTATQGVPTPFEVARERLTLSPEQYALVSTPSTDEAHLAARYGVATSQLLPSSHQAAGTVSVASGSTAIAGTGTQFLTDVPSGSQVQVGAERRTVVAVGSDTAATVDGPWSVAAGGTMTVFPVDNLGTAVFFAYQTSLDWDGLDGLVYQGLDDAEVAAGLSKELFVNRGSAQPLALTVDGRDPYAAVRLIGPLTVGNLDRVDRFLRLSLASGIGFADLDWAMRVGGVDVIDEAAVEHLAQVRRIATTFGIPITEAAALFSDMKTTGVVDAAAPQDLFDRTFNSPTILGVASGQQPAFTATGRVAVARGGTTVDGDPDTRFSAQVVAGQRVRVGDEVRMVVSVADRSLGIAGPWDEDAAGVPMVVYPDSALSDDAVPVYHPAYARNPLYGDPVLAWDVAESKADPTTRQRLLAALHVSDDDLTMLGTRVLALLDLPGTTLDLTVEHLSQLYSSARMAALVRMPVREYLTLLELLGVGTLDAPGEVLAVADAAAWLLATGISVDTLAYLLTGEPNDYYKPAYSAAAVPQFLTTLWAMASTVLLYPSSFVSASIDEHLSTAYFDKLLANGHLTTHGAVLPSKPVTFAEVAAMNPVRADAFVSPEIDAAQSAEAHAALQAHDPPVLLSDGSLSPTFTAETDIDYVFPDDPGKVSQVRAVLVNVRSGIDYVLALVPKFAATQAQTVYEQTGVFLGGSTDVVAPLLGFVAATVGTTDYVSRFLAPPGVVDVEVVRLLLRGTARALAVAQTIPLDATEVQEVIANPQYFVVGNLAQPTFADIRNLSTFRDLERIFDDEDGDLVRYFEEPATTPCDESTKVAILAELTHWDPVQICTITSTYWPGSEAYDTVTGVAFMKSLFDYCGRVGVDVGTLLSLAGTASIATVDGAGWEQYDDAASSWLSIAAAHAAAGTWDETYAVLTDELNVRRRDALTGATIHALQQHHAEIRTNSDLYDYFLMDVDMSGCGTTSLVQQAISSVQLYLQRARMMLEPGVTDLSEILPAWWTWLASYRLWEVNRKIFLYPENYLDPAVSDYSTPLFEDLQANLTANEVTEASVTDAYRTYFDGLSTLAALKYADTWWGPMADPATGRTADTLAVVGRTAQEPYTYYWRTWVPSSGLPWAPWRKIDLTINAPTVTTVVVLDRPYLFWSELESTGVSSFTNNQNANAVDTRVRLLYTFADPAGRWMAPQALDDLAVGFSPPGYATAQVNPATFDFSSAEWAKPLVYPLKGTDIATWRLLVLYGGFYLLPTGSPAPPAAPAPTPQWTQDQTALAWRVYRSSKSAVDSSNSGNSGSTFVNLATVLDSLLSPLATNLNVLDYTTIPSLPQPYLAYRDDTDNSLRFSGARDLFLIPYWSSMQTVRTGLPLLYNLARTGTEVRATASQMGWFVYDNGDEAFLVQSQQAGLRRTVDAMRLNDVAPDSTGRHANLLTLAYTTTSVPLPSVQFRFTRLGTGAMTRMRQALFAGGVPQLLSPATQRTPTTPLYPFSRFYKDPSPPVNTLPPALPDGDTLDYDGPYGTYLWEVFFQIPFLVANQLRANRRFQDAKDWYEYVFEPTAPPDPTATHPNDRYWQFLYFRGLSIPSVVAALSDPQQIQRYNDDPFDPDAIARLRKSAYQKAIVMRYIGNLLEWGDSLFAVDTAESINQATLLYVLARDLLGPKPVDLGELDEEPPATFADILEEYHGDIPQFLINLEHTVGTLPPPPVQSSDPYVPFNDLHTYFCVPENEEFVGYWDLVDDRLTKIRSCMNIEGQQRALALFEPPLDPRAVIRAASAGQNGLAVATQRKPVFPPYRFSFVLGLARDLVGQLVTLGGSLLSAIERQDAEQLALIRQSQELAVLNMTTLVREKQIEELLATKAALGVSLANARFRSAYYQELLDRGLSPAEVLNIVMMVVSNVSTIASSITRGVAAGLHLVPNVGSPFAMTYGGRQLGPSVEAAASVFDAVSAYTSMLSTLSLTAAGYERRAEEWGYQVNLAGFDVDQTEQQLAAVDAQIASAQRQLQIHLKAIEQSAEIEAYLRGRFDNDALYQWMIARISVVFFQAYLVALDMALSAQLAYQFELSTDDVYVDFDYWDSLKRGLLSGEQLMLGLDQLQAAYVQGNTRALEIQKTVSLFQTDPRALLNLRTTGVCEFDLNEALYDLDYPGHYNRKIKTVSVSIPALVGPYQNVKATLIQKTNNVLVRPDPNAVKTLLGLTSSPPPAGTIRSNWRANQQIAISTGVNDAGLFEVNLNDERYLPFEGTGAVSSWRLELPPYANLIDFDTISDVVVTVRYTAFDGGTLFRGDVISLLRTMPSSFARPVLAATEFPTAWYSFTTPPPDATEQEMTFVLGARTFPANLTGQKLTNLYAQPVLANGVGLGGQLTATLTIGTGPSAKRLTLDFTPTSNPSLANLSVEDFIDVPWVLTVDLSSSNPPPGIRHPVTGTIDPTKLLSIAMVATYTANRTWS